MDAQTRRRERRAEKQAQWKAANPLLVGVSAKPVNRPILSLNRKPKSRVESALNPIDLTCTSAMKLIVSSLKRRLRLITGMDGMIRFRQFLTRRQQDPDCECR